MYLTFCKKYTNLPLETLVARPVVVVIRLEASSSSDSKKLVVSNSELNIEDEPYGLCCLGWPFKPRPLYLRNLGFARRW